VHNTRDGAQNRAAIAKSPCAPIDDHSKTHHSLRLITTKLLWQPLTMEDTCPYREFAVMRNTLVSLLIAMVAFSSTGCIKTAIMNGQISATRTGADAVDTIGDYELARAATSAGIVQFEGMHRLAPDNEDALFLVTKGWVGYAYAFAQDDYETSRLAGDDKAAEYHKVRARNAFDRGIAYGIELLGHKAGGFESARKNAGALTSWLKKNFTDKEDAETLFWTGSGWLARVDLMKDDDELGPGYVSELFVGVAMLERSRELDPAYLAWNSTSLLATYHARASVAELDEAKAMFEVALAKTHHKSLSVFYNHSRYACAKSDRALYEKLLNAVLSAGDPDPNLRLQNTVAKRRAKRALSKAAMEDCGFFGNAPASATPPPVPTPPAKRKTP